MIFGATYEIWRKKRYTIGIPWICGTIYAATDEIHQLFVPGRSGQVRDVLIDSCGVFIGVMVVTWIVSYREKRRSTK